jgi:hypothetical protein
VVKPSWVDAVGTTVRNSAQQLSNRLQTGNIINRNSSGSSDQPTSNMGAFLQLTQKQPEIQQIDNDTILQLKQRPTNS